MRTIKFRQRNLNNGQFHYWGPVYPGEFTGPMTSDNYVRPEESNEFTGLLDRSGIEIYEGDFIQHSPNGNGPREIYEVVWWSAKLAWAAKDKFGGYGMLWPEAKDIKKIGNVWENPEMLKQ